MIYAVNIRLTVTKVVFEYNKKFVGTELNYRLTVTKVVFELTFAPTGFCFSCWLTVTKVVFELYNSWVWCYVKHD